MDRSATIVIAARNAAATIERAIDSARAQGDYPIILIDDYSTDETVARAQQRARRQLRVLRPPEHRSLGVARQMGLMAVETPLGVWLDADDELLPGRVERMVRALHGEGVDIMCDEVELFDGTTGTMREVLHIPGFLRGHHPLARLFERNYLPGPGTVGFRAGFAQRIGYDPQLNGAEDIDFLLRAIAAGGHFRLMEETGYRLYAYPASLSRQIGNQRQMNKMLLAKHDYSDIRGLYRSAGYEDRITIWGLVSVALFREEYDRALEFLAQVEARMSDPAEILEPTGPCPRPEGWRISFQRGTTLALLGRFEEALPWLEKAEQIFDSAEGANNYGVVMANLGFSGMARKKFAKAAEMSAGYLDARINTEIPSRITVHPLRVYPNRRDYS